jgi:hypothetical protein
MGSSEHALGSVEDSEDVVTLEDLVSAACPEHNWQCARERSQAERAIAVCVCRTCTTRAALPEGPSLPSIVCQACADACHADHDTFALGNKHGLVCQCAPPHCALSDVAAAPLPTSQVWWLREHHNARNRFCVCDAEYQGEKDDTMHQCIGCEDWFHVKCLGGLDATTGSTDGLLVCTACRRSCSPLALWVRAAKAAGSVSKPLCIAQAVLDSDTSTQSEQIAPIFVTVEELEAVVCPCDACSSQRNAAHLEWLFDEEQAADGAVDVEMSPFPPSIQGKRVLELEYAYAWGAAKRRLYSLFQECARENRVVTERDVRLALAEIQREIQQTH